MRYYKRRRKRYKRKSKPNFIEYILGHVINLFINPKKRASAISFLIRWATAIFLFKDIPITPNPNLNNTIFKLAGGFILMKVVSHFFTGKVTTSHKQGTFIYFIIWMILLFLLWLIIKII